MRECSFPYHHAAACQLFSQIFKTPNKARFWHLRAAHGHGKLTRVGGLHRATGSCRCDRVLFHPLGGEIPAATALLGYLAQALRIDPCHLIRGPYYR
jgi:hypothetical protein